jgi:hypothetical protein
MSASAAGAYLPVRPWWSYRHEAPPRDYYARREHAKHWRRRLMRLPERIRAHLYQRADALDDPRAGSDLVRRICDVLATAVLDDSEQALLERAQRLVILSSTQPSAAARALERYGIPVPHSRASTHRTIARRYASIAWWLKKLRRHHTRMCEEAYRVSGLVHQRAALYLSNEALAVYRNNCSRAADWREAMEAFNESTGELLDIARIYQGSLSHPRVRRAELMLQVRGLEEFATALGFSGASLTLTAASAFHPYLVEGRENPHCNLARATVLDAQRWLMLLWSRARARFKKESLVIYGFRVVEPHHDGTPHWHMLVFGSRSHLERLHQIVRETWLAEYAEERGAPQHRIKFELIDPRLGSAVGYIAKYISKGTDAHGSIAEAEDHEAPGKPVDAERIRAWCSIHGVRQFQFFQVARRGAWRELRRLKVETDSPDIERVRVHCNKPCDYCLYLAAQDWKVGSRDRLDVVDYSSIVGRPDASGRLRARLNQWGEIAPPQTVGIAAPADDTKIITRPDLWILLHKQTARFIGFSFGAQRPWTRGHNCNCDDVLALAEQMLASEAFQEWARGPPRDLYLKPDPVLGW